MKWLEHLIVRRFVATAAFATVALLAILGSILRLHSVTLDQVAKATDTLLKALAILLGAIWSLNRYFAMRTDYPQLRVDAIVDALPGKVFGEGAAFGLLSYRLDIVNTGKVLLRADGYRIEIANVILAEGRVLYENLYEWPGGDAWHQADPIEPGSWAAISNAVACPSDVQAVRLFLEVKLEQGGRWTWHRILTIAPKPDQAEKPALDAREPAQF